MPHAELMKSVSYYENGNIKTEIYRVQLESCHNDTVPAYVEYNLSGQQKQEKYFLHGKMHNEVGPAEISFAPSGNPCYETYRLNNFIISNRSFFSEKITLIRTGGASIKEPIAKLNYYSQFDNLFRYK